MYCNAGKPQDTYTGYQVELFRELAQRVSWLSNSSAWFFDCMPWTPMVRASRESMQQQHAAAHTQLAQATAQCTDMSAARRLTTSCPTTARA